MNEVRKFWVDMLIKMANPILTCCENQTLYNVEMLEGTEPFRKIYFCLEAVGRLLSGMASWLETPAKDADEESLRKKYAALARTAINDITDPYSPDYAEFSTQQREWNRQWLVDAAYLSMALLRAPNELINRLSDNTRQNLIAALKKTRYNRPVFNNWLLFPAMIEAALDALGEDFDLVRIDYALRQTEQWYLGDGFYGDGPHFQNDYYNAFAIQSMMLCLAERYSGYYSEKNAVNPQSESLGDTMLRKVKERFKRYARIQELSIAPDGSFPVYGRSLVYRCGAFQTLADAALRNLLPSEVSPAMARCGLTAVIQKTLEAPGTFSEEGWLQFGLCGHQPRMAFPYNTTASLYMASLAFLPLGLPEDDEFWSAPDEPGSWEKTFSGEDIASDHSLLGDQTLY